MREGPERGGVNKRLTVEQESVSIKGEMGGRKGGGGRAEGREGGGGRGRGRGGIGRGEGGGFTST